MSTALFLTYVVPPVILFLPLVQIVAALGLCGTSTLSPASFVVAATFFATAVGVTFLLQALTGGAL